MAYFMLRVFEFCVASFIVTLCFMIAFLFTNDEVLMLGFIFLPLAFVSFFELRKVFYYVWDNS